jgi:hypothetical protein
VLYCLNVSEKPESGSSKLPLLFAFRSSWDVRTKCHQEGHNLYKAAERHIDGSSAACLPEDSGGQGQPARVFAALDALDCPRPPRRRAAPLCRPRSRERPHLDLTVAGPRPLGGELDRHVEIGSLDNPQAAEMLLRLDEGPVGEQRLAAPVVDYGRRAGRREAAGENPVVSRVSGSFAVLRLMCLWARSVRPPLSGWLREPTRLGAWKCCADSRTS